MDGYMPNVKNGLWLDVVSMDMIIIEGWTAELGIDDNVLIPMGYTNKMMNNLGFYFIAKI